MGSAEQQTVSPMLWWCGLPMFPPHREPPNIVQGRVEIYEVEWWGLMSAQMPMPVLEFNQYLLYWVDSCCKMCIKLLWICWCYRSKMRRQWKRTWQPVRARIFHQTSTSSTDYKLADARLCKALYPANSRCWNELQTEFTGAFALISLSWGE